MAKIKNSLTYGFALFGVYVFFKNVFFVFFCKYFPSDEELFWESHPFESSLEKADNLCEIGNTFQRNEIIYKKSLERSGLLKF